MRTARTDRPVAARAFDATSATSSSSFICSFICSSYFFFSLSPAIQPPIPPMPAPINAPAAVPTTGIKEPIAAPATAPAPTPLTFIAPEVLYTLLFCASVFLSRATLKSLNPLISAAPAAMVPAAAPPPTAIIPAPEDAVLPRPIPNFPNSPAMPLPLAVPIPASSASRLKLPIALPARDETALRVSCPITALPMSNAPLPTDRTGFASFDRKKAENNEDISADSPPGRSFPALFTIFPKTPVNFDVTALRSKPSENPFANDFPMLTPSFTLSDTSIPRSISRDVEM